jgi:Zn-dependent protease
MKEMSVLRFKNIVKSDDYRIDAEAGGLRTLCAGQETFLPWERIEWLAFREHLLKFGYAMIRGVDGEEIAWTDHELLQKGGYTGQWSDKSFKALAEDGSELPILSVKRGTLLAAVAMERAGFIEQADGIFVRPTTLKQPEESREAAGRATPPEHTSPDDVLKAGSTPQKRIAQVFLFVVGFVVASKLWGVEFAIGLYIYLMIHEYGHVVGMKLYGVPVHGIFVLPFMGAVAIAEDEAPTRWQAFMIAYMGPVFGALVTLGALAALFATKEISFLREFTIFCAAVSIFNLLPLGILDGGRIVMNISFSTHRAIGFLASIGTILLCVAASLLMKVWFLWLVAIAAFLEMLRGMAQHRVANRLEALGCAPERIRKGLIASWERMGPKMLEKKARVVKDLIKFLRPFFLGRIETKMSGRQILAAILLYIGLFLFFIVVLVVVTQAFPGADEAFNRGFNYHADGHYEKAISEYNKAIKMNPQHAMAYNNRGIVYESKGQHDKAISDFGKALEINPKLANAYVNRGSLMSKLGNTKMACYDWKTLCELGDCYYYENAKRDGDCE